MPNKGYKQTEEHPNLGIVRSEEWRRKQSEAHNGQIAWNKGLTKEDPRVKKSADKLTGRPKSKEQIRKVSETKRRLYTEGKIKTWNKGLTAETDERIKKSADKLIGRNLPKEQKHKQSETMKRLFAEGKWIPPMLGKKFSEEHRKKIGLSRLGKKISEETKKKMSMSLSGENHPMYGKHLSEETRKKLAKSWDYDKHFSKETRLKMGLAKRGIKFSEEHKRKLRESPSGKVTRFKKGQTSWIKGKHFSEETKKKMSCQKQGIPVEKWEKFTSREPYSQNWDLSFKNLIRKRDNQVCMNCGIHRERLNKSLHIHHINYDKLLTIPENCISLCNCCHTLTNYNREYWTKLFQEKLSKFYNYQYDEPGRAIINLDNQLNAGGKK